MYTYIEMGGGELIHYNTIIYKEQVTLKVRLNDKIVVGLTKLGVTQRNIGYCVLSSTIMSYNF